MGPVGSKWKMGVFLDAFDKEPEAFFRYPRSVPFPARAAIRDIFKRHSQEITGKREKTRTE